MGKVKKKNKRGFLKNKLLSYYNLVKLNKADNLSFEDFPRMYKPIPFNADAMSFSSSYIQRRISEEEGYRRIANQYKNFIRNINKTSREQTCIQFEGIVREKKKTFFQKENELINKKFNRFVFEKDMIYNGHDLTYSRFDFWASEKERREEGYLEDMILIRRNVESLLIDYSEDF